MKFRGTFAILAAMLAVVAIAANANAAKLIVTDTQAGPAGSKIFTVAVQLTASDGVGVLGSSIFLTNQATNPIQTTAAAGGVKTLQLIQDRIDAGSSSTALTQDTWFYGSDSGQLTSDDGSGPVQAVGTPASAKLIGAGLSLNPLALVWSPSVSGFIMGNISGVSGANPFNITALWGNPISADPAIAAASIVGPGTYPIMQIRTLGDVFFNVDASQGIAAPNGSLYNVLGGLATATSGLGAFLSFNATSNPLAINATVPEPSTLVLAGLGLVGALIARRRRK